MPYEENDATTEKEDIDATKKEDDDAENDEFDKDAEFKGLGLHFWEKEMHQRPYNPATA